MKAGLCYLSSVFEIQSLNKEIADEEAFVTALNGETTPTSEVEGETEGEGDGNEGDAETENEVYKLHVNTSSTVFDMSYLRGQTSTHLLLLNLSSNK